MSELVTKRLTPEVFQELLDAHPEFRLTPGCWSEGPCGGCALTLAYHHAHPSASLLVEKNRNPVNEWAISEYGDDYTDEFIYGFDGDRSPRDDDDTHGVIDGFACMRLAYSLGRLE